VRFKKPEHASTIALVKSTDDPSICLIGFPWGSYADDKATEMIYQFESLGCVSDDAVQVIFGKHVAYAFDCLKPGEVLGVVTRNEIVPLEVVQ